MKKVLTFLILLITASSAVAQNFPVQSNVTITPPYSVYLSDYASIASNKLMVSLMLKDINQSDINIKLKLTIRGNGIELSTKQNFQPQPILLQGGAPLQLSGTELESYINPANLDFSGISRSEFVKTGKLPEGVYQFIIEAVEYRRNVVVSNPGTTIGWLVLNDPPRWTLPMNNGLLTATYPQNVFFSWMPMNTGSPNAAFTTEYEFTIVELWPDNRSPGDAINSYSPIFQTTTNNTSLVYGPGEPELTPSRKYVCRLRAYDTEGRDLFKNNGYSEILVFTFGQACKPPNTYNHQLLGAEEAKVTWTSMPGNTQFIVSYSEQNADGTWSNWYHNETIMPWSNIKKLKPEQVYRYQIKAVCGTLESEYSEIKEFTTPAKEEKEIECGKDLSIPDVDDSAPLPLLSPGDKIDVGGFTAKIIESEGSNGTFSGKCVTKVTTLGGVRILSEFEGITINENYQVTDGEINSVKGELNIIDVDAVLDSLGVGNKDDNEDVKENNETADSAFIVPEEIVVTIDGEKITVAGDTTIITANGDTITTDFSSVPPIILVNGDTTTVENGVANVDNTNSGDEGGTVTGSGNTQIGFDNKANDVVNFGPIAITLKVDPAKSEDANKCDYSVEKVDFELKFNDQTLGEYTGQIDGAKLLYSLDCESGNLISATITWENTPGISIKNIGFIDANISKLELSVDNNGKLAGKIDFKTDLNEDKTFGNFIVIRKGISGDFTFAFDAQSDGFNGDFDFNGVKNINLDLLKQQKVLASLSNGELSSDGKITSDIALKQELAYTEKGFDIGLKNFNANITYKIGTDSLQFNSISGKASVNKIPGVSASLDMSFAKKDDKITAAVENAEDIKIFGINLSAKKLEAQFNNKFELLKIEGKAIDAAYKSDKTKAEGEINIKKIVIQDNKLDKLSGSGYIAYEPYAKIDLTDGSYDSETNKIVFAASVDVEANEGNSLETTVSKVEIAEDGIITLGEVSVDLIATIGPLTVEFEKEPKNKKTNITSTKAKVSFAVKEGDVDKRMTIETSVDYRKDKETGFNYLKVDASKLNQEFPDIFGITNTLESVNFLYEKNEENQTNFSGKINFTANLTEDKTIFSKNIILRKGLKGNISFEMLANQQDGISGKFDLSSLTGMKVDLVKEEKTVASLSGNFSKNGTLTGMFKATEAAEFKTNAFKTTLNKFDVKASYNIKKKTFKFIEGAGKLTVSEIPGMEGSLAVGLAYKDENFIAELENKDNVIKIAGMEIKDLSLAIQMDTLLNINKFEGSAGLKHNLFNSELDVHDFVVEKGKITKLDAKGNIEYKKFKFDVTKATYVNQNFSCNAKVLLGESYIAVEKFNIDKDSKITVGKVKGELKKSLMSIKFEAAFAEDRFKGTFDATLSKKLSMSGAVDMGASSCGTCSEGTYPFGYYKLTVGAPVPIFPGISISELGGEFGYNYYKDFKKNTTFGEPQKGKYLAGLTFGLQDQAGLVEVAIDPAVFAWGNNEAELDITGTVKVPKVNPIIDGRANLNLKIPSYDIYGSVDVDVNIPPKQLGIVKKGGVFNADATMNFEMTETTKSFAVTNLSATVLSKLKFKGSFENTRYYNKSGALTSSSGNLKGSIDFGFDWEYKKKKTLWEVDCRMDFAFNAFLETAFTDQGISTASFGGSIKSSGNFYVSVFAIGSINPYYSLDASAVVKYESQDWYLNSEFSFTAGINDKTWDFDGSISRKLSSND